MLDDPDHHDSRHGAPDPRDRAEAEARLRAEFQSRLPGATSAALDVLVSGAKLTSAWSDYAMGDPLDVHRAVNATLDSPAGLIVIRRLIDLPPALAEAPAPAIPAMPPGLAPAAQITWARDHIPPLAIPEPVPVEEPPAHLPPAERMSWHRARIAADDGSD